MEEEGRSYAALHSPSVPPSCPTLPSRRPGQCEETLVYRRHSPGLPQKRAVWRLVVSEGCWEPKYGLSSGWKRQSLALNPGPLSLCVFINLKGCLFLSEISGLTRALELGGEAQKGLHS